jgi:hypothetical protein
MAMKALNPMAPFWFTPDSEERTEAEESKRTKFKIRGLDGEQLGFIQPELRFTEDGRSLVGMSGKGVVLALQFGLLDWENVANDQGPVAFSPANFRLLPMSARDSLALKILVASYVQEPEKKT